MRVLILNWRDPWHPRAGGAETVTFRVAERLANWGWDVEWFSGAYPGCVAREKRDGIRFLRRGTQLTVHLRAWQHYRKDRTFDVVIDEINTIPFYAHRYLAAPSIAYINQLAGKIWQYEAPAILGHVGLLAEPFYLRAYRDVPIVSISQSSADSLRAIGLRGPIRVVSMSVDEEPDIGVPIKTIPRDVVVLGRVTPSKRIEHAIDAAVIMRKMGWGGRLLVIGTGEKRYVAKLERHSRSLLAGGVQFFGRVADSERTRMLRSASCLWMTSVREGWGLAVTEAARHGTPAVVYGVAGLVDSVVDGVTGYVVAQTPSALAAATARLFDQSYGQIARASLDASRLLNWDDTAHQFDEALRERIGSGPSVNGDAAKV